MIAGISDPLPPQAPDADKELIHRVFDSAALGMAVLTTESRFLEVNQAFCDITGYSQQELKSLDCATLTHPDDFALMQAQMEKLIAGQVTSFVIEKRYLRKDGQIVWVRNTVSRIADAEDRPSNIVALCEDITTRKQVELTLHESEERWRAILETTPECVKIVARDGRLLYMNTSGLCMIGAASPDAAEGKSIYDIVVPECRDRFRAFHERVCDGEKGSLEFDIVSANKVRRHMRSSAAPLRALNGEIVQLAVTSDITQERLTEAALRESEERLRLSVEAAGVGLWDVNLVDNTLYWPPRVKAMFGISPEAPVSMADFYAALHPDDFERTSAAFASALDPDRRALYEVEYRAIGKEDGVVRWIAAKGRGIFDEHGVCTRVIGTAIDITARKQTEAALRESEEFNRGIVASSPDCLTVLDIEGNLLAMSEGGQKLLCIPDIQPYLNKSWIEFWGAEYREMAREAVNVAASGGSHGFVGLFRTLDGQQKWFDVRLMPILDVQSKPAKLLAVSRDITEQKQSEDALRESEERFRMLADNMAQLAWMADSKGLVFWYNQRWFDYTGTTLEEMQGWGWKKVHHPEHVDRVVASIQRSYDTGEIWEETFPLRGKDGIYRSFLTRAVPFLDAEGKVVRWFGTNTDVSERLQAEDALRRSEKLAAVGRVAATMAHEINNPLEAVTNLLYLIEQDATLSEESRKNLVTANQELDRVGHITKQTLGLYRDQAGPTLIHVAGVIDELLTVYGYRYRNRHISIEKDFDTRARAFAAAGEFRQVLSNLIVNALDAIPGKTGRIRIRVRRARDWRTNDQYGARISIADNGSGIRPTHLARIFEPFFTTKQEVGTGLGLWVSRDIVQKYHGRISVRSSADTGANGTIFSVFWPEVPFTLPGK